MQLIVTPSAGTELHSDWDDLYARWPGQRGRRDQIKHRATRFAWRRSHSEATAG